MYKMKGASDFTYESLISGRKPARIMLNLPDLNYGFKHRVLDLGKYKEKDHVQITDYIGG